MQRPAKFARCDVVRIISRSRERAGLFGEFGTVLMLDPDRHGKPLYVVDVYRGELTMRDDHFREHELHATGEVDGFYSEGDPITAARRDLARAIERNQLYVCLLSYLHLHCPSHAEGIHFSEEKLVEGLPKRSVCDCSRNPAGYLDRSWSYVTAFNRGLMRHLAATAPIGSWQRRFLRRFSRSQQLKPVSRLPLPSARTNPEFSALVESLEYGELALAAARGLTKYGLDGVHAMIRAASNPDPFVKTAIISTVKPGTGFVRESAPEGQSKRTTKALVRMLVHYLHDEHWDIRMGAAGALAEFQAEPELVVPALMKLLNDPDRGARYSAVSALCSYGPKAKRALRRLREYCKTTQDESEHNMAQYAIRQIEAGQSRQPAKPLSRGMKSGFRSRPEKRPGS